MTKQNLDDVLKEFEEKANNAVSSNKKLWKDTEADSAYNVDIDITFDNRITNHYKLIVFNKTFEFNIYDDVINALNFLITCGDEK